MRRAALLGIVLSCLIAALAHWLHVEATEAAVRVICRPSLKQALVWNGQRIRQEFRLRKAAERQILTGWLLVPGGSAWGCFSRGSRPDAATVREMREVGLRG